MDFDVSEHMKGFEVTSERLGREIGPRNYELKKLSRLADILKLARLEKPGKRDTLRLKVSIRAIAQDMDHLNSSRFNVLSSGGNAEILARMVGSEILNDFPSVKDGDFTDKDFLFSFKLLSVEKTSKQEIELHTEFTRPREEFEGSGDPVTTVADFRYSLDKLNKRKKQLNIEIEKLWKPYIELSQKEDERKLH